MRQFLVATLCVLGVTACSSMPAPNVEQVSEATRPAYLQLFADDAAKRCSGAHAIASLRPVEEPTVRRLVTLLTDDAIFE